MSSESVQFASLSDLIHAVEGVEIVVDRPADMLRAALWYAQKWMWPVFPLHPGAKAPMTRHGFKDATCDPDQIRQWWLAESRANIGVPTGPVEAGGCGFDVLDVDGQVGMATYAALASDEIPEMSAMTFTPGDPSRGRGPGRHHWTPSLGDGNSSAFLPGCDWRGAGGFVVAPPSVGPAGSSYAWLLKPDGKP